MRGPKMKKWILVAATFGWVAGVSGAGLRGVSQQAEPKYEMTTYYVGFLYRGAKWTPEVTPEVEKLQEGHMANIRRMAKDGKLILAGPFSDNTDLRGMFVFQTSSIEEARTLCDADPAVQAGRLRVELHPWFSAKGIRIDPPTQ